MLVCDVKSLVTEWVENCGATLPNYLGALFRGSITEMADDAEFPVSSDVDLGLIFEGDPSEIEAPKKVLNGVLVSSLCWSIDRFVPLEKVLSDYRIGFSFQRANVIQGASNTLLGLAAQASRDFPKRHWVNKRVEDAQANCLKCVASISQCENEYDRVICWLWATGITTHIILAAALKNPTVRKRYLAARNVLAEFGHSDFYEFIQDLQGACEWDRPLTEAHLHKVTQVFDLACQAGSHPFPFGADICAQSRPSVIEGTQALIDQGDHREAVYWIVATFARSLRILDYTGDQAAISKFKPHFDVLLADLGLHSVNDIFMRTEAVKGAMPQVMKVAESIMDAHPRIVQ